MQQIIESYDKSFGRKYCVHAEAGKSCQGKIIKAHTIQRGGGLEAIARDHKVYYLKPNYPDIKKSEGEISPKLVPISRASTFTGFCKYHDNTTFQPIEDHPFQSCKQHTFLLTYRALAREYFGKRAHLEVTEFCRTLDRGKDSIDQLIIQAWIERHEREVKAGVRELNRQKSEYDDRLKSKDYSDVEFYVVNISETPDFLVSGALTAQYGFEGELLQDWDDLSASTEITGFSIIKTDTGGAVVFSWLPSSRATSRKLVSHLHNLPDGQLPHAITRFAFEYFENIVIAPEWWENLPEGEREALIGRMRTGLVYKRNPNSLRDDGVRAVSWTVSSRDSNVRW